MVFIKEIGPSHEEVHLDNVENKTRSGITDFTRHIYSRVGQDTDSVPASPRDTDSVLASPQDHKGKRQLTLQEVAQEEERLRSRLIDEHGNPMEKLILSKCYDKDNPGLAGGGLEDIFETFFDAIIHLSPEVITRLIAMVGKTIIEAKKNKERDKKIDQISNQLGDIIHSNYNTALSYLKHVDLIKYNKSDYYIKTRCDELEKASDCFIAASSLESDEFMQAKAMVYAGVCYELRDMREIARHEYGRAYNRGNELWQQKTEEIKKIKRSPFIKREKRTEIENQLLDFDQFMDHLRKLVHEYPAISASSSTMTPLNRLAIESSSSSSTYDHVTRNSEALQEKNKH